MITPRNAQVLRRLLDAAGGDPALVREVMHRHGRKQSDGSYSLEMKDAEALLKTSRNHTCATPQRASKRSRRDLEA